MLSNHGSRPGREGSGAGVVAVGSGGPGSTTGRLRRVVTCPTYPFPPPVMQTLDVIYLAVSGWRRTP